MCGIAGVFDVLSAPVDAAALQRMTDCVAHRGPDGAGTYRHGPVGLGHRRLAIIDLSDAAHEPMANEDGNVVLVFNGEIYNFKALREELERLGHRFKSLTDAEVLVHGYEVWGDDAVGHLNGMFAFALYDRRRNRLLLGRDRYGVKPLYWTYSAGTLLFGSEIKAILAHGLIRADVSRVALNEYFSFQNLFSDATLFEGVRLLPPGTLLSLVAEPEAAPVLRTWWDYPFGQEQLRLTEDEAADELHRLFVQAVVRQTVSDVPVGAYLSGGMDSGSITAIAGLHLPRLRTFTGGFDLSSASGLELAFDERRAAEMLAARFKTEHYEVVLHAGDMEEVLPALIWHLEDLRVGQSYPNYYVARLAAKFVKVVLSGTGGDELFGGYPWRYYRGLAAVDREDYFRRYYGFWQRLVSDEDKPRLFNEGTRRRIGELSSFDAFRAVFRGYDGPLSSRDDYVNASLYFELKTFLHGLLVVEDRLSMAHALETRVPFLDNDLVDFAIRLPPSLKVRNLDRIEAVDENVVGKRVAYERVTSDGKIALRRAMERIIPPEVTERAKQGFSAPDASWFRGESIQYINRLLRDPRAMLFEFIEPAFVAATLDEHTSGRQNHRLLIWSLLSFEWWCRTFLGQSVAPGVPAARSGAWDDR
ncbi:MAG: asparagine synthase (glutamine-hydrolyzing) [Chloroflexota bacterium]|nr:MAG: asparagine synthase (glutamine-hydrolyzing) [Chloroflexota bacterium]